MEGREGEEEGGREGGRKGGREGGTEKGKDREGSWKEGIGTCLGRSVGVGERSEHPTNCTAKQDCPVFSIQIRHSHMRLYLTYRSSQTTCLPVRWHCIYIGLANMLPVLQCTWT